ncbi:hypothetical protein FQN58_15545 [Bacteroides xylanisolvens]|uniref:hypothetical protein n=1 Tax=Bacteroides xylanisolvens TaxID=371601 RepID=UPI001BA5A58C|nr:hypothetical protein [Bacteroides xylanisolvens]QUR44524.1 hypothetical protein FQN58_15545 [Bacteroides xylanisolvens]
MKKLKKLKLVKEDLYHLNENELGNVIGGQCIGYSGDTLGQNCIGTYYCFTGNFCETDNCGGGTNEYCGTLKNCGTGAVYCATEGCFFETNGYICG